jgi:hypothetical protein
MIDELIDPPDLFWRWQREQPESNHRALEDEKGSQPRPATQWQSIAG